MVKRGQAFRGRAPKRRKMVAGWKQLGPRAWVRTTVPSAGRSRFRGAASLGAELKFADQSLTASAIASPTDAAGGEKDPSATVVLNSVVQGDGEQQRDGRKMTMKSLYINGVFTVANKAAQSTSDAAAQIFCAIVLDTQSNGTTIVSEQVYKNTSANAGLAASPMRNLDFGTRYRVLASKVVTLKNANMANDTGATGGLVQAGLSTPFKFFIDLKDLSVTFNGTAGTISTITDNSLHLIAYASDVTMTPLIAYNSRLRFMG